MKLNAKDNRLIQTINNKSKDLILAHTPPSAVLQARQWQGHIEQDTSEGAQR